MAIGLILQSIRYNLLQKMNFENVTYTMFYYISFDKTTMIYFQFATVTQLKNNNKQTKPTDEIFFSCPYYLNVYYNKCIQLTHQMNWVAGYNARNGAILEYPPLILKF